MTNRFATATVTCVNPRKVDRPCVGREFDAALLDAPSDDVDPCGENGEFHAFAWAGPMFTRALSVTVGEVVEREGFVFADVPPT